MYCFLWNYGPGDCRPRLLCDIYIYVSCCQLFSLYECFPCIFVYAVFIVIYLLLLLVSYSIYKTFL
jgi:hypothetical protein